MTRYRLQLLLVVAATVAIFFITVSFPSQNLTPFMFVPTLVCATFASPIVVAAVGLGALSLAVVAVREGITLGPQDGILMRLVLIVVVISIAVWLAWLRQRKERELFRLSTTDALTGLANRSHLTTLVAEAAAKADPRNPLTLVFLDLDNFKDINDEVGHLAGDEVLVAVSDRLRHASPGGVVARFGGDEFVILTSSADAGRDPLAFGTRVLTALREPFTAGGKTFTVTASVGVARASDASTPADDVIRLADNALYSAKYDDTRQIVVVER